MRQDTKCCMWSPQRCRPNRLSPRVKRAPTGRSIRPAVGRSTLAFHSKSRIRGIHLKNNEGAKLEQLFCSARLTRQKGLLPADSSKCMGAFDCWTNSFAKTALIKLSPNFQLLAQVKCLYICHVPPKSTTYMWVKQQRDIRSIYLDK